MLSQDCRPGVSGGKFAESALQELKDGVKRVKYAKMQQSPKKYSLEWYLQRPIPSRKQEDLSSRMVFLAGTIVVGMAVWSALFH